MSNSVRGSMTAHSRVRHKYRPRGVPRRLVGVGDVDHHLHVIVSCALTAALCKTICTFVESVASVTNDFGPFHNDTHSLNCEQGGVAHENERNIGFGSPKFSNGIDGIVAVGVDHEVLDACLMCDPAKPMKNCCKFTDVVGEVLSNLNLREGAIQVDRPAHIDHWPRSGAEDTEAPAASDVWKDA